MDKLFKEIDDFFCSKINAIKYDNPKLSVIIPAHNSEKYITKCLFSIVDQTLKDIEIIIVDDGSTDKTSEILSVFSKNDARIRVINQEHKLQGAARNKGINVAKGEYIGFVDSDDWVDENYFEKLYETAEKYDADIALATNIRIGNGKTKKRLNIVKEEFVTDLQGKVDVCKLWKDSCPTNKIYKTELIKNNNILFPEGVYCEDKLFTIKAVYYSNGIVTVPETFYYYYRNLSSTSHSKVLQKGRKNDKNNARLAVVQFLRTKNAQLRDGDFCATTKNIGIFGIPIYTKKESLRSVKHYIFSVIKIREEEC